MITEITVHYTSGRTQKIVVRGAIWEGETWDARAERMMSTGGALRVPASARVSSDAGVVVNMGNVEHVETYVRPRL